MWTERQCYLFNRSYGKTSCFHFHKSTPVNKNPFGVQGFYKNVRDVALYIFKSNYFNFVFQLYCSQLPNTGVKIKSIAVKLTSTTIRKLCAVFFKEGVHWISDHKSGHRNPTVRRNVIGNKLRFDTNISMAKNSETNNGIRVYKANIYWVSMSNTQVRKAT